jgi:thiol-disulfide isomerase/thioredoxin
MISAFLASASLFIGLNTVSIEPLAINDAVVVDSIVWLDFADVNKVVEKNIKKDKVKVDKLIIVDFYTDWCGWCKRLDNETYKDPEVVALMNKYFYPIKFDAEQRDSVQFAGVLYKFKSSGSRGTNEFALNMASRPGGRIGYPTITIISPMGEKVAVEAGFKNAEKMKVFLIYYGEGHYKTKDYVSFEKEYNQKQLTD